MRRILLLTLLILLLLLVVAAGLAFWLLNDEDFIKGQAAKYTRQFTGRELVIAGPLDLQVGAETTLDAREIRFRNAEWAESPDMVTVGHLRLTVDIPSLFGAMPVVPLVQLEDCRIELETSAEGEKNWDVLPRKDDPEPVEKKKKGLVPVVLNQLLINNCRLTQDSPQHTTPLDVRIETARLEHVTGDRLEADVQGSINEAPLTVEGWLAPASAFNYGGELRHELTLQAGQVTLESTGSVADIDTLSKPQFQGQFHGPAIHELLGRHGLPPVAEGPFDLRAMVDSTGDRVKIEVDGDIGNLDLAIKGDIDNLLQPGSGYAETRASGPNLRALGEALGVQGLVPDPFEWAAEFTLNGGVFEVDNASLATGMDELTISGNLSMQEGVPNSNIVLALISEEIGRWGPLFGKNWGKQGAIDLDVIANTDASGVLSIDGSVMQGVSTLQMKGEVGPLAGPYDPDMEFDFSSTEMPRLASLIDQPGLPGGVFNLKGRINKTGSEVQLNDIEMSLDNHRAVIGGRLVLDRNFGGSDLDIHLEIPDLAALGGLFGRPNLPAEALVLNARLQPEGEGLAFQVTKTEVGDIRLSLDGKIADIKNPIGVDADFDIHFPNEEILYLATPKLKYPSGPLSVRGSLVHDADITSVREVRATLGENAVDVDGTVSQQGEFELDVAARGPDAAEWESLIGTHPGNVPFDVSAKVKGNAKRIEINDVSAVIGKSEALGNFTVELSDITRVTGDVRSKYLNVATWTETDEDEPPAPDPNRRYKFDDTPVMQITDLGVEIELDLEADVIDLGESRIDELAMNFLLRDNLIQVKPFTFRDMRGALLSGGFTLDSHGAQPQLNVDFLAEDFHPLIGAKEGQDPATLPSGDFMISLNSSGQTKREMASNLDGVMRMQLGPGKLAPSAYGFLMTDFLGQLFDTLNPFTEAQEYTQLDCAVVAADIESGLATIAPIILHTEQLTIVSEGTIDLNTEKLDVSFNTKQRKGLGISATDLVNPFIKVGGTLVSPTIILDAKSTVVKGGIAVATMGISILANSLAERYLSSKDPCGDAIRAVDKREKEGR
jgi:uncharacterized protein involved in outer membrane biogenesis